LFAHHYSTRGKAYEDFYCLSPVGIRAAFPTPALLRRLPAGQRSRYRGRIVLLLTSDRHYALRGVRPGTRLSRVARRLGVWPVITVGPNNWYILKDGANRGVFKVRRGIIQEIGLANYRFTRTYPVARHFFLDLLV
jgi:hypothetical protein